MSLVGFRKYLDTRVLTPEALAKKHKVSVKYVLDQLRLGAHEEREHSTRREVARHIALKHLEGSINYYSKHKIEGQK